LPGPGFRLAKFLAPAVPVFETQDVASRHPIPTNFQKSAAPFGVQKLAPKNPILLI
jgi:hypothetical protein